MTLKLLTLSSLFPSEARPRHGIFVETRLLQLLRDCPVDARVIAPVPWFPSRARMFGSYASYAATPRRAIRHGLQVAHPRYPMLPRWGMAFQPDAMAHAAEAELAALQRDGWTPDLIDAHYLYPDGVAAAIVAERCGLPLVITARGTDANVIARLPGPGRRIRWAAQRAAALIAVSTRLRDVLAELDIGRGKLSVLRNGVDVERFQPLDREASRRQLGLPPGRLAACVGNLVPEKGQQLAMEAMVRLPGWHLALVGDGPARGELEDAARRLGLAGRVHFVPTMPQERLAALYSSADVLLLCSTREGWPNVVLEALACGTPVVGNDVGAVGEILTDPMVGRVVPQRDAQLLAAAVEDLLRAPADRAAVRAHAARFDWRTVSLAQWDLFGRALLAAGHPVPSGGLDSVACGLDRG